MRGAAHGDDLADGEVEVGRRVLDHRRHGTGQLPHRQRPGVASVDEDLAGVGAQDAVDGAQEACLPAAVGADEADGLARTGGQGDVAHQVAGPGGGAELVTATLS
ncbi:hypothetical protein RKD40_000790 [Streptomyces ambofaciens]